MASDRSDDPTRHAASSAADSFAQYNGDLRKVEKKVAGEIDPGARAIVVALAVLVGMVSFVLPHAGSASGLDVLIFSEAAQDERITITSRVFVTLVAIFGIGFSALGLLTRRWLLGWIALCGSLVACAYGLFAWWSRNTPGVGGIQPPSGVGIGLIVAWLTMFVLAFHWARVVWARSAYQLTLEEERRREAAVREEAARALQRRED